MARGTQHRKRRPAQNARPAAVASTAAARPRKERPPQWQEQLFFQRLRVHAKWAFVLLALVFALGFVFLGIGSGSNGITDALQSAFGFGSNSGSSTSISKLERKTQKEPGNVEAWRDLATAYETKQRTNDAISALTTYTTLRPKDTSALAELASQYTSQAQQYESDYQLAQVKAAIATPAAASFAPAATTPLGKAFTTEGALKDPIAAALQSLASTAESTAYSNYQEATQNAEATYQKLVKLTPKDANAQLQLGQAAEAAQDTAAAITAYEEFLKLAPTDPLAAQVRSALKSLKAQATTATSGSGSG